MEPITLDELLRAVEDAHGGGEGFTVAELRAAQSMGVDKARGLIRRAMDLKMIRASRKTITDISGRVQFVPSYVIVKRRRGKP